MNNKEKSKLQKRIVNEIEEPIGRLILAPRSGKTKLAIDIIKKFKPKSILWVTPERKLADEDIPAEFLKWRAKGHLKNLTTTTWASLNKHTGNYDLIILDEEQYITENNASTLISRELQGNILAMTGTKTRDNDKIELYNKLNLKVLYDLSISTAVDKGILSDYDIVIVQKDYNYKNGYINRLQKALRPLGTYVHDKQQQRLILKGAYDGWVHSRPSITRAGKNIYFLKGQRDRLGYYAFDDEYGKVTIKGHELKLANGFYYTTKANKLSLFNAIKNYRQKTEVAQLLIETLPGKKLIFGSTIKQVETLCKHTFHSKTNKEDYDKFQNNEIDHLGLVNAGGVGHTYKDIDHLIIVQADSDRNGRTSQKITRTLLKQDNYKAKIWIINLSNTEDDKWVQSTLESFDDDKVKFVKLDENKSKNKAKIKGI